MVIDDLEDCVVGLVSHVEVTKYSVLSLEKTIIKLEYKLLVIMLSN